ncbi:MAG: phosphotyrosine protein phosphatase [Nanoarchaeota archaeon]|nr:phosphotyrosine protein phosphatase [Nanoarchaeota archaeon]
MKKKILFVCTLNQVRSRLAEEMYAQDKRFEVRSAGVSIRAEIVIDKELTEWADRIFVMEAWQKEYILKKFSSIHGNKIVSLDISEEYIHDDVALRKILGEKIEKIIQ